MTKVKLEVLGSVLGIFLFLPVALIAQNTVADTAGLQKVTEGFQFTEGPYWHADGYLLFSDIPANSIYRWTPGSEESEVFMNPSGHSNGIAADSAGNLILAQHDGMVSMINDENKVVVLANSFEGKRLNSPNDVTVASDGTIYFTDPPFGVGEEKRELSFSGVFMLKADGEPQLMYDQFNRPNGIVLSPDESKVYVNNTPSGQIMVFERGDNGELMNPQEFANVGSRTDTGGADGMAVDKEGRLYSTGPGGIHVFSADGKQVQTINLPAYATNLGWGGEGNKTLFITTPSAIYSLEMKVEGVKN